MADFNATIAKRDARLVSRLGRPLLWTKTDESTVEGTGLLELSIEIYGDSEAVPYLGKAVVVQKSFIGAYKVGESITDIGASKVYRLQRVLKDDGYVRTIEVTG